MDQLSNAIHRAKQACQVPNKQPYFLDFENNGSKDCHTDRLGRTFETTRDIKKSQNQISCGLEKKQLDWTQRFRQNQSGCQPTQLIKVDPINSVSKLHPYDSNGDNPHSGWGINSSHPESIQTMTPEYLAMKQAQERTQLEQNAHNYGGLSDEVKFKHAKERQVFLERSNTIQVGGQVLTSLSGRPEEKEYVNVKGYDEKINDPASGCLSAQGEWLGHNPHNYLMKNKYAHLKSMSPEMMNQIQGKPIPGDVRPIESCHSSTSYQDVFRQTSFNLGGTAPPKLQTLNQMNMVSQNKIMKEDETLQSASCSDNPLGPSAIGFSSII